MCLSWCKFLEFSETPPAFKILMFLNEVMQETRKICTSENGPIGGTPKNLPVFKDETYQLFSYSYGLKVPKWKCAHILLYKMYKHCTKLINIADIQPPDWIQRKKNTLYISLSPLLLGNRRAPDLALNWMELQLHFSFWECT